jgi:hypothetical protein
MIKNNHSSADYQKCIEELKNSMVNIFDRTRVLPDGSIYEIRAVIGSYKNLKFEIFPNEHPPPHFHVTVDNCKASFKISDCELLKGSVKPNDEKKIKYWYKMHKELLIESWNAYRPDDCSVGPIT